MIVLARYLLLKRKSSINGMYPVPPVFWRAAWSFPIFPVEAQGGIGTGESGHDAQMSGGLDGLVPCPELRRVIQARGLLRSINRWSGLSLDMALDEACGLRCLFLIFFCVSSSA